MEIIRRHHYSIFMCACLRVRMSVSVCGSVKPPVEVLDSVRHVWATVTQGHIHMRLHASAQSFCLQALRQKSVPKFKSLLIPFKLFNRKLSEIWLRRDSNTDNSVLVLAPCHSYLVTPSVPLGADRLMGSYCCTFESEEGKLWPLPCSLSPLFYFAGHFSGTPSLYSLLVFSI